MKGIRSFCFFTVSCLLLSPCALSAAQVILESSPIPLNNFSLEQLQQAAEAGDPDAQYALGYMHYYGQKVTQNTAQAVNWIKRASVQGQEQATRALAALGQDKQPSIVAAAETASTTSSPSNKTNATSVKLAPVGNTGKGKYTIQLLASSDKKKLDHYIKQHHLQGKATYSHNTRQGKSLYVLTYGNYPSRSQAQGALAALPAPVRSQRPWVKGI